MGNRWAERHGASPFACQLPAENCFDGQAAPRHQYRQGTGLGKPAGRPCHGTSDFGCERELIMNFRAISCLSWQKNRTTKNTKIHKKYYRDRWMRCVVRPRPRLRLSTIHYSGRFTLRLIVSGKGASIRSGERWKGALATDYSLLLEATLQYLRPGSVCGIVWCFPYSLSGLLYPGTCQHHRTGHQRQGVRQTGQFLARTGFGIVPG